MKLEYDIDERIVYLRDKLNQLVENNTNLVDHDIIHISQLLDDVLNEYNIGNKECQK